MNDYARIAKVIRYLDECHSHQPHLAAVAALLGQSPFHFHRLFKHWAGITPKAFVQCLTLEEAKRGLQAGRSESDSTLDDGLSGPGRLHDLCVKLEAASPDEIKSGGQGLELSYGIGQT
ncbi:MAG: helix-turn-helix domain-containing protein, partial [Verrucomicrobiales bacterium]